MMTSFKTRNLIAVLFTGFVNYWEWTVLLASIYPYIASVSQTLNCPDSPRLLYKLSADQPPKISWLLGKVWPFLIRRRQTGELLQACLELIRQSINDRSESDPQLRSN